VTRKRIFWGLIALLLAAPAVVAEAILRSVGLGHPILFYTNDTYRLAPQPNQRQERLRGATVTIDSKGLRSTRDWTSPADAKILFVGDSITWGGTYIGDRQTFAEGVCSRLEAATGRRFVCGNAGVNGYGTDNMAERIRHKNVSDESALIITLISHDTLRGMADITRGYFHTQRPPGPFIAIAEAVQYLIWRLSNVLHPPREPVRDLPPLEMAERTLRNLFSAIRETARGNRKVLIVYSPFKPDLVGPESELTKHVRKVLLASGFDIIDFHREPSALADGFFYDDAHLDAAGHRVYAERIAAKLQEHFVATFAGSTR
jgi:lysophospholipase L1-like esterase